MHQEGVKQAVMAGQVNTQNFQFHPRTETGELLFSLPRKNTDALIGAVARVLERKVSPVDSTLFLKPLVPDPGYSRARPMRRSGGHCLWLGVARQIASIESENRRDRGSACVAVEA